MSAIEKKPYRSREEVLSEIIGPLKAVLFVSRMLFWWPHAKRKEGGKLWIYKSRREWAAEIGVSMKSLERYVTMLRKGGWIETAAYERKGPDGQSWGVPIQHIRPTDKLVKYIENGTGRAFERPKIMFSATKKPENVTGTFQGGVPLKNEGYPPSEMRDHKEDTSYLLKTNLKKKHKGVAQTGHAFSPENSDTAYGEKEDIPSGYPEEKTSPQPLGAQPGTLAGVWHSEMAKHHPEVTVITTIVQKGMLKNFSKACPDGEVAEVIAHTVENWTRFTEAAKVDAGAFNAPARPTIPFLLKYAGEAVTLWKRETTGKSGSFETVTVAKPKAKKFAINFTPKEIANPLEDI